MKQVAEKAASSPHIDGSIVLLGDTKSLTCFLEPLPVHIPNGISIGSAVFAQLRAEGPYTLHWAAPFPSKLPLRMGNLDPHLIHGFSGPLKSIIQNGISIGSAVFAGLTTVTDRPTDRRRYSVCNNRPHLRTQYGAAA